MSARGLRLITASLLGALLVAGLAGCSESSGQTGKTGNTGEKGGTGGHGSIEAAAFDWELDYAKCLREAGYDYPDPIAGSDEPTQVQPGGDTDKFMEDSDRCEKHIAESRGDRPVTEEKRQERDHWNDAYAPTVDCLRKKGYDIEVSDGGWNPADGVDIPDSDFEECSAGDGSQGIGGAE